MGKTAGFSPKFSRRTFPIVWDFGDVAKWLNYLSEIWKPFPFEKQAVAFLCLDIPFVFPIYFWNKSYSTLFKVQWRKKNNKEGNRLNWIRCRMNIYDYVLKKKKRIRLRNVRDTYFDVRGVGSEDSSPFGNILWNSN